MIVFTTFREISDHCENVTGCRLYSGVGICHRIAKETCILRSVDNTPYYADDLDKEIPVYTLFGHNGDQSIHEPRYNEPLLNPTKIKHIYMYRVRMNGKRKEWVWYGKYKITGHNPCVHPGKDNVQRTIILVSLQKIN